ncbi:MAG: hypothetical protein AAF731_18355 [Bacteroidota bacterium]
MSSLNIRPRFKKVSNLSQKKLEYILKRALSEESAKCIGYVGSGYSAIKIPVKERHFWSPQLTISFEETEGQTNISGLYGPNPTVWAVFFFGYVTLVIIGLFILVIGFSRISLGMSSGILWVIPVLLTVAAVLYIIAQAGQKIGAEQMYTLHHFFEDLIHDEVNIKVI